MDNSISYLSSVEISTIDKLLKTVTVNCLDENYNSQELNSNRVYPEVWHDNESSDRAFNKGDIIDGIGQLKSIFNRAKLNESYIFVFSG
ncbi:DUF1877 family protein [Maribacter sp. BPC-D8]|uniref:DUF1877 family protein n=1 Tax=Maribacter sp. BPC-D8 TaxID=3053613 RepID=UPI002B47B0A0|nr:DUF1877 family protein [Maribacter sp. BPC-D8]WRI31742.1 DUF1877 family protein [Maribacter sp. BPC-D8]